VRDGRGDSGSMVGFCELCSLRGTAWNLCQLQYSSDESNLHLEDGGLLVCSAMLSGRRFHAVSISDTSIIFYHTRCHEILISHQLTAYRSFFWRVDEYTQRTVALTFYFQL
jgi:hypothetical protein